MKCALKSFLPYAIRSEPDISNSSAVLQMMRNGDLAAYFRLRMGVSYAGEVRQRDPDNSDTYTSTHTRGTPAARE